MGRPRLLDAFCGAGGATRGYQLAGFHVTGVDNRPQPRYCGDAFHRGDALEYIARHGHEFDAIAASPPCQRHSRLAHLPNRDMTRHPDLIAATRRQLAASGRHWVIENVPDAPLVAPFTLCGAMFGLRVYRHRCFEATIALLTPPHSPHRERIKPRGRGQRLGYYVGTPGEMVTCAGHLFSRAAGSVAMGIDWMTRDELAQAIPPAYTQFIGAQLLRVVTEARAA
jgi:DNA (cytosine-5)-methyltransferase 1